jgi:DHA1 family bicyclomycin/chloramphenicol resistance-like MFS transporter
MGGAFLSGKLAGKMKPARQIRIGFTIMFSVAVLNLALNALFAARAWWAIPPIGVFSFGWALMVPVVTLLVLDQAPLRRGMASSLQACIGSVANAFVAGVISPLVMHSTVLLALASLLMSCIGIVSWIFVRKAVIPAEPAH